MSGGIANSKALRRPSVARRVIPAMVELSTVGDSLVADEVAEDAFQRLVGRQQLAQPDALVAGQAAIAAVNAP